jgi:hypothetical protein
MKSASSVCIGGYTFRMKNVVWLIALGILAGLGYWVWLAMKRYGERKRAAEERFATFVAQTMKPPAPRLDAAPVDAAPAAPKPAAAPAAPKPAAAPARDLAPQALLFEAAAKAGEAGEPALSIQLYARLIARYPDGALVPQARAAVEAQKRRLAPKP